MMEDPVKAILVYMVVPALKVGEDTSVTAPTRLMLDQLVERVSSISLN